MTEAEWLASFDLRQMLESARSKIGDRQLRLFAVTCCRLHWSELPGKNFRKAVKAAEQYLEGERTEAELQASRGSVYAAHRSLPAADANPDVRELKEFVRHLAIAAVSYAIEFDLPRCFDWPTISNPHVQADILRDIAGNPFRPVALDPRWLTSTVLGLASAIYAERAFDRLPILADALEEAGCDHPNILVHCRGPGPHVRGCWVVDLILGKS
jgi:hypothetical protein